MDFNFLIVQMYITETSKLINNFFLLKCRQSHNFQIRESGFQKSYDVVLII